MLKNIFIYKKVFYHILNLNNGTTLINLFTLLYKTLENVTLVQVWIEDRVSVWSTDVSTPRWVAAGYGTGGRYANYTPYTIYIKSIFNYLSFIITTLSAFIFGQDETMRRWNLLFFRGSRKMYVSYFWKVLMKYFGNILLCSSCSSYAVARYRWPMYTRQLGSCHSM